MKVLVVGLTILTIACGWSDDTLDMDSIIKEVNDAHTTWSARHNFHPETPAQYLKTLTGTWLWSHTPADIPGQSYSGTPLPDEFDARKQWPQCPTVSHILDQGSCGSCWAVAVASAFSDRVCIASNGTFTSPLSAEELMSCTYVLSHGCDGGLPWAAWDYTVEHGLATGGDLNSGIGCQPYTMRPCRHHAEGPKPNCTDNEHAPPCSSKCTNPKYDKPLLNDLHKAKKWVVLLTVEAVQEEILLRGPIVATFFVYSDFYSYSKGVYKHVTGVLKGGHAVRVIGWGTENGTPYWLVANSWGSDWGDHGTFKILRGANECGIENISSAGLI